MKIRKYSTEQIKDYLSKAGNSWKIAPERSVREVTFWQERQWLKNVESRLVTLARRERLLDVFTDGSRTGGYKTSGLKKLLASGSQLNVRFELERWRKAFESIVEGREEFNHWVHEFVRKSRNSFA